MPRGRLEDAYVDAIQPKYLKFSYVNWRGDDHEYVVEVEAFAYGRYDSAGSSPTVAMKNWVMHGNVITRDGDPRPEMGGRRRTFLVNKIREPKEIQ